MAHQALVREITGADTVVLCVHGIVGSPDHFTELIDRLPPTWSVVNLLLDGHGGEVSDFSNTSMTKWEQQVQRTLDDLSDRYQSIWLVGHSMGTLLLIEAALARPEKVQGLFLLAVPLWPALRPVIVRNSLRVAFDRVPETDAQAMATKAACSVRTTKRLWQYLGWLPRFFELFDKMKRVRARLPEIAVPCVAVQSAKDELVAHRATALLQKQKNIHTVLLEQSAHFWYAKSDRQIVLTAFDEHITK